MQGQRYGRREDYQDRLDEDQIREVLEELGVEITSETSSHFLVYCPVHDNTQSSAATISKENGFLFCFSAECEAKMHLVELVRTINRCGLFPAMRLIKRYERERKIGQEIRDILAKPEELPPFDKQLLLEYQEDFWDTPRAKNYIKSRGISKHSAELFGLGYDRNRDMVVTPMFDTNGTCVGVIRRSIDGKEFKNSFGLPKSKTLFGIHIAKRQTTDKVVVCESNFDAIRAFQSGYAAVATLGAGFNEYHGTQLSRSFSKVVIGVDVDEGGEQLTKKIAKQCKQRGLSPYRIRYSEAEILPHGAKDFGDCTDKEIAQAIRHARPVVLN